MTDQDYIDSLGNGIVAVEAALKVMRKALRQTEKAAADLHAKMETAQKAYIHTKGGNNVVAFSGGSNKPDPDGNP